MNGQLGQGFPLGSAPAPGTRVTVTGYGVGLLDRPISCTTATGTVDGYPSFPCAGFPNGTSGGPWVADGAVVGVIGGYKGGGDSELASYSAQFGSAVGALLGRAQRHEPGDQAPFALFTG